MPAILYAVWPLPSSGYLGFLNDAIHNKVIIVLVGVEHYAYRLLKVSNATHKGLAGEAYDKYGPELQHG